MMLKIFKFMVTLIMVLTLFTLAINVPSIWNTNITIRKVQKVMVKYAQKNGGFVPDESGRSAEALYNDLILTYGLDDKINQVVFSPSLYTQVNKRERFSISIEPRIKVFVPFGQPIDFVGGLMVEDGYSHKFFK